MKLQKLGGIAAIASVCMTIAYYMFFSLIQEKLGDMSDPIKVIAAVTTAPVNFYVLNLMTILANLLGMIFICALYKRLKNYAPNLALIMLIAASWATALYMVLGMIFINAITIIVPARDASAYRAMNAIIAGMTSMSDHAWGWVYLLLGCVVLKIKAYSTILGWMSILVGVFWIPWFILKPFGFDLIGTVSLAPFIISTIWFGVKLLRQKQSEPLGAEQHTRA
jgi:hypothetical protein